MRVFDSSLYISFISCCIEHWVTGEKLRTECIDLITSLASWFFQKGSIKISTATTTTGRVFSLALLQRLWSTTIHADNIMAMLVSSRELPFTLTPEIYGMILRKLEDVPSKDIPSALYQVLLLFRNSGALLSCFETILALVESQKDRIDVAESISCIKLAIQHEASISRAFLKYSKSCLKLSWDPSPFLIILLLCMSTNVEVLYPANHIISLKGAPHR